MKLLFFPTPYPDELFYSLAARYHKWSGNLSHLHTLSELFGSSKAVASVDFPLRLQHLADRIECDNDSLMVNELISNNTLLPLFKPFRPINRTNRIIKLMKGCGKPVHLIIGGAFRKQPLIEYLKYCPECARRDTDLYGEPYWHRSHQLIEVKVCHEHAVWLIQSDINTNGKNRHRLLPLCDIIMKKNDHAIPSVNHHFKHYLSIARAVYWLLNHEVPVIGLKNIRERYAHYFKKKGFTTFTGLMKKKELLEALNKFYGASFLDEIKVLPAVENKTWLTKSDTLHSKYPVFHILLQHFLGFRNSDFWNDIEPDLPFGKGPWPCLNPASSHYRKKIIKKYSTKRANKNRITGFFECSSCGFAYNRRDPDKKDDDIYKKTSIVRFGSTWKSRLKLLIGTGTTLSKMSNELGISKGSLKSYIKSVLHKNDIPCKHNTLRELSAKNKNRAHLLKLINQNHGKSRSELNKLARSAYAWLMRKDRDWLLQRLPPIASRASRKIDWHERDINLSIKVKTAAQEIIRLSGKPKRINIHTISRHIAYHQLRGHLSILPKTKSLLNKIIEGYEDFQIRRIYIILSQMLKNHEPLSFWTIYKRAGLKQTTQRRVIAELKKIIDRNKLVN